MCICIISFEKAVGMVVSLHLCVSTWMWANTSCWRLTHTWTVKQENGGNSAAVILLNFHTASWKGRWLFAPFTCLLLHGRLAKKHHCSWLFFVTNWLDYHYYDSADFFFLKGGQIFFLLLLFFCHASPVLTLQICEAKSSNLCVLTLCWFFSK